MQDFTMQNFTMQNFTMQNFTMQNWDTERDGADGGARQPILDRLDAAQQAMQVFSTPTIPH